MKNKINISIDDISPHPQSSVRVLESCYRLIDDYPSINFTLFVPMAYTRHNDTTYDVRKYEYFCEHLKNLPNEYFELGWHGVYHGVLGQSNNDEFKNFSKVECAARLQKMFKIAKAAGIHELFKPMFRPPALRMSPESFDACREAGLNILALSEDLDYGGKDKSFKHVVYYDCNPPHKPLQLKNVTEIMYHACEWDRNYLGEEKTKELRSFLDSSIDDIEFVFMREMINE